MTNQNSGWTDVGQIEEGRDTAKAICLNFGGDSDCWVWIPKRCYRKRSVGRFVIQEVKSWLLLQKCLMGRVDHTVRGT